MGCLAQVTNCLSSILEQLGVYEPVIDIDEAKNRLQIEKEYWEEYQGPENYRGTAFEMNCAKIPPLPYFFLKGSSSS